MCDVSGVVINSGIGCHIRNMTCNILLYADDIVILTPSWHAQKKLLDLCHNKIFKLSMNLNLAKTVTVIFAPYGNNRRVLYLRLQHSHCVVIQLQIYIVVNIWVMGCRLRIVTIY